MTATEPDEPAPPRDPHRPARLLRAEHDALVPILHRTPDRAFDRPTVCPGWSVRDVLAHCAAALSHATAGTLHAFTPALNEIDVAKRRTWPLADILSELSVGYLEAGTVIAAAGGKLDALALGEWLHGGDVRDALGEPHAYASDGFDDACALLADRTRRKGTPLLKAYVAGGTVTGGTVTGGTVTGGTVAGGTVAGGTVAGGTLTLGVAQRDRAPATLDASRSALMRLFAGRPADTSDYQLTGATTAELVVF